jgi:hypothetical protein
MFRLRLHPTPSAFAVGIAFIALWALLWVWFISQLAEGPRTVAATIAVPELTSVALATDPRA